MREPCIPGVVGDDGSRRLSDNPSYWFHGWTYPLHVGSVLGIRSKIVWLLACLVLAALPVTGLWMWWSRRPAGRSGFPRRTGYRLSWWQWGSVILCLRVLPLAGVSVVIVSGIDWLVSWFRRPRATTASSS
ncbi:hypothetical protein Pan216_41770 [Planctomycetes bacterium Pan216]|uniref:PepSY-associated TM helix n=1 Tax=Kolteria novifilia TaxID=2527975 RepID=A0A518B8J1_9BACT|nr:hypothetical protein Pan216_41770 [Planctomycetes bacterium Pan216]